MLTPFRNLLLILVSLLGLLVCLVLYVLVTTPRPNVGENDIKSCLTTQLYSVRICPGEKSYLRLAQVSTHVKYAIISSEDSSFYSHNGFDWHELRSSLQQNLDQGRYVRGGSTITQQLAKNVYLTSEKSILRKVREAIITLQLEDYLSKNEILEKYLNVVEFGPGIYGISAASQHYFQKPAVELTVAEAAWMAFVLPNPKKYSESFKRKTLTKFASSQVRKIIQRMEQFRYISTDESVAGLAQARDLFGYADTRDDDTLDQIESLTKEPVEQRDNLGPDSQQVEDEKEMQPEEIEPPIENEIPAEASPAPAPEEDMSGS